MRYNFVITLLGAVILSACSEQTTLEESAGKLGIDLPSAVEMSTPDIIVNWMKGCDEAFKEKISVVSPDTEIYVEKDGKKVPLSSLNTGISIPWLTVYSKEHLPVYHQTGYLNNALEGWQKVKSGVSYPGPWPTLETVAKYSDLDISKIPETDLIFVKYSADWCAPCKAQSADLKTFKDNNPDLNVAHIEVIADTRNLKGKCPVPS